MFKARRIELLEHAIFSAINDSGPDALQAVEMWKYAGVSKSENFLQHNGFS